MDVRGKPGTYTRHICVISLLEHDISVLLLLTRTGPGWLSELGCVITPY